MTEPNAEPKKPKAKPVERTPEQQIKQLKQEKKQLLSDMEALHESLRDAEQFQSQTLLETLARLDLCEYDEATAALIRRLQARLANC